MTLEVGTNEYLQFKYEYPLRFEKTVVTIPFKPETESAAENKRCYRGRSRGIYLYQRPEGSYYYRRAQSHC